MTATEEQFFGQIEGYLPADELASVCEGFMLARQAHGEQRRRSGELFFTHPLTVAYYLALFRLDGPALTAALLHDVAEDTKISIEEIEEIFGTTIAKLVDGVTKLKNVSDITLQGKQVTPQELQDITLHKLLDAMTNDVRTVVIKLFDRLHNMRTIRAMPVPKQIKKAQETITVYAPLANRLGIWKLKSELEGRSLEIIHPHAYQTIRRQLNEIRERQQARYEIIRQEVIDYLTAANIDAQVSLEPQNIYTVYQDTLNKGISYTQIDDTLRLEILARDHIACYTALGHLHQYGKPLPGTFDDYIAVPRDNLYRSLHTTIIRPDGQHIKLRLRTEMMDKVSEIGILVQWRYADTAMWSEQIEERIKVFLDNIHDNIHVEPHNPGAGVAGVVEDIFRHQIRVYTPTGQMIDLPEGATPLDFAYAIHTGLGNQCQSAYVNDNFYPLNRPLRDGYRVQIAKRAGAQPRRSWLDEDLGYITTNYARSHIRRWFRRLSDDEAISQGRDLLKFELQSLELPDYPHAKIATSLGYHNTEHLYYSLGRAEILPTVVATRIVEDVWEQEPTLNLDSVVYASSGEKFIIASADGRRLHLCGTCNPRPGDMIMGLLRKDGGVTVHRDSCHLIQSENLSGRLLKLDWSDNQRQAHIVTLQIDVYDRPGLLLEIANLVGDEKINIPFIHTPTHPVKGQIRIVAKLEIVRPRQLIRILHQIQALPNVISGKILPDGPLPSSKEDTYLPPTLYRPE